VLFLNLSNEARWYVFQLQQLIVGHPFALAVELQEASSCVLTISLRPAIMLTLKMQVQCGLLTVWAAAARERAHDASFEFGVRATLVLDSIVVGVALFKLLLEIVHAIVVLLLDFHDFC